MLSRLTARYPNGVVVDGSYVFLSGTGTANLKNYIRAGESNRVVVTQVWDSAWQTLLKRLTAIHMGGGERDTALGLVTNVICWDKEKAPCPCG